MIPNLSRFEDHIQRLVEGGFARLFAGRLHPYEVAIALARAMEDHLQQHETEQHGPDVYTVRINPTDHSAILQTGPDIAEQLAAELVELARVGGVSLTRIPEVQLLADEDIPPRQIAVSARHSKLGHDTTQAMPLDDMRQQMTHNAPRATLILDDQREVALDQPIINIGRQHDNSIIFDIPGISRHHVQIRLRFGHYVLFDLGSTAGTTVNGERVQERVLQSGDVIRLSDSVLIYVEENISPTTTSDQPLVDTQAHEPLDI
jgi:hypothetical protein